MPSAKEGQQKQLLLLDRKSTRLNSSHTVISYAVFCLKKKKPTKTPLNGGRKLGYSCPHQAIGVDSAASCPPARYRAHHPPRCPPPSCSADPPASLPAN